jgi:hypothetical protein
VRSSAVLGSRLFLVRPRKSVTPRTGASSQSGQAHRFAAGDGQHCGVDGIEVRGRAALREQVVGGKVPGAGGQRERSAAGVLPCPRQVDVGAGVEQHRDDRQAAPAGDGVVQAAAVVDVDAPVEEPPQLRLLTMPAWPPGGGRVRDG